MQACKALGLRQDDLVATSDVIAGKGTSAACSALWSVASACVERCYKVSAGCSPGSAPSSTKQTGRSE